jgi:uncharacterized membrane protein
LDFFFSSFAFLDVFGAFFFGFFCGTFGTFGGREVEREVEGGRGRNQNEDWMVGNY